MFLRMKDIVVPLSLAFMSSCCHIRYLVNKSELYIRAWRVDRNSLSENSRFNDDPSSPRKRGSISNFINNNLVGFPLESFFENITTVVSRVLT